MTGVRKDCCRRFRVLLRSHSLWGRQRWWESLLFIRFIVLLLLGQSELRLIFDTARCVMNGHGDETQFSFRHSIRRLDSRWIVGRGGSGGCWCERLGGLEILREKRLIGLSAELEREFVRVGVVGSDERNRLLC